MPLWSTPAEPVAERAAQAHTELTGSAPTHTASAPATWSLIGEHIDHFGGIVAMYAWRSVYLSELVSLRTRALVLGDFIKRELWGRDVSWL